jgi:hypothetical protein|tara:strand:+ start:68 stop:400 length:333 start_codon:yes stop_codon:yes gene_type:complete
MRAWFWIFIFGTIFLAYCVDASESNQVMKECLLANGYSPEKFDATKFSEITSCSKSWSSGILSSELIKTRMFLAENPKFAGPNWDWAVRSSTYSTCTTYHVNNVTICASR